MDGVELEGRPRQPLMLKEWLELESSAELSRDGFGCYPRHLAAELRSANGRRRNGDVVARFSAAVRAALSRPPAGREGEAAALSRSLSRRLRAGFWRKRRGEAEETDRPVASCSAASSTRRDAPSRSPAMSPRRTSWEGRQAGGDSAGLSGGRRSYETEVEGCECETTCHLDEEREQEQRLSPVSVMDFPSQDRDDGNDDDCNDHGGGNGQSEDDGASPTFEQSLANIRRASQQLLQRIRRFEQLAEIDASDVDDATTTAEDTASCHVEELDNLTEDGEGVHAQDPLLSLPEAGSPCAAPHCFKKLLQDFFGEGLSSCQKDGRSDDPEVERSLLETASAWLDGRHRALRPDGKAEVEEIERLGRWRWFREDERELLGSDVEGGIFWSLMEELVDDLC
ncbi:hypothetical protein SETIT_7G205300v2 [Setaria italica]|uniref:DUF4378 domain-containing protein n=2 Tax=Setaria italica TaxID=4555 RepID=A0A368RXY9_SETIT|nr:uncharacterized protein LOC101778326 [Setaria italica]RCV35018.1 hypothetical protein SETIT_7G205300v2 [Setaria italica]